MDADNRSRFVLTEENDILRVRPGFGRTMPTHDFIALFEGYDTVIRATRAVVLTVDGQPLAYEKGDAIGATPIDRESALVDAIEREGCPQTAIVFCPGFRRVPAAS